MNIDGRTEGSEGKGRGGYRVSWTPPPPPTCCTRPIYAHAVSCCDMILSS